MNYPNRPSPNQSSKPLPTGVRERGEQVASEASPVRPNLCPPCGQSGGLTPSPEFHPKEFTGLYNTLTHLHHIEDNTYMREEHAVGKDQAQGEASSIKGEASSIKDEARSTHIEASSTKDEASSISIVQSSNARQREWGRVSAPTVPCGARNATQGAVSHASQINATKAIGAALTLGILLSCTSCTGNNIDKSTLSDINDIAGSISGAIEPNVNREGKMRTNLSSIINIEELINGSNSGLDNPSDPGGTGTDRPTTTQKPAPGQVDPKDFAPTEATMVDAESYSKYLTEKIWAPINSILQTLPAESKSNIYFRVFFSGYTATAESTQMEQHTTLDRSSIGSLTNVKSTCIPRYAQSWLCSIPCNSTVIEQSKQNFLTQIQDTGIAPKTDWITGSKDPKVTKELSMMWGNERLKAPTLGEFIKSIHKTSVGTLPNLKFQYYMGGTSKGTITLNPTSDINTPRYTDHMTKYDLGKLFVSYNQSASRNATPIKVNEVDSTSMIFAYCDGYTRTLVILGVPIGEDLNKVLGSSGPDIAAKIAGIKKVTDWVDITAIYPDCKIIQKGTKGIN